MAVYGPGGCGKSVLLWQLLWLQSQYCICKIEAADKLINNWLPRLVNHKWRNLPPEICPYDTDEIAIQRLVLANSGIHKPVLWLGLDGLDEGDISTDQKAQLKLLIESFWQYDQEIQERGEPSDAVLILTYRDENHIRELLGYLPGRDYQNPLSIHLDEFDEAEIHKGFEKFFSQRLNQGLLPFYARSSYLPYDLMKDEYSEIRSPKFVLSALHHPVTWYALLNLDSQVQEDALDGNPDALARWAENILVWFDYKVRRRRPDIGPPNVLVPVLASIARNTEANHLLPMRAWINLARNYGEFSFARALYFEAANGGLIDLGSDQSWRWKHQFVYDYLMKIQG